MHGMKKRRGKKNAILVLAAVLVLTGWTAFHLGRKRSIACSLAWSWALPADAQYGTWSIVSGDGFYTGEMFARDYEAQTGEALPDAIDTDQYSYVVCYGFTLEELYVREGAMSGRFTASRPYYYANAVLRAAPDGEANLYRIHSPTPIDRDPHSNAGDDTAILGLRDAP